MATGASWRLYQIPNPIMEDLYRKLDSTEKWKELAGQHLHRSQDDIRDLEHREWHGVSPGRVVLQDWSLEDPSVDELFVFLSRMRFYRAMNLIKDYVGPRLHVLLQGEGGRSSVIEHMKQRKQKTPDAGPAAWAGAGAALFPPPAAAVQPAGATVRASRGDRAEGLGGVTVRMES